MHAADHSISCVSRARKDVHFSARYHVRCEWLTRGGRDGLLCWDKQSGLAFFLQPIALAVDVDGGGMVQESVWDRGGLPGSLKISPQSTKLLLLVMITEARA